MTPTIQVEIGFGSTWQTEPASITWTDVSSYVLINRGISIQRGASSARGQVDAGSLRLSLLNTDRRFDPTYAAGPHYGDLLPGVPIRVSAGVSGVADTSGALTWGADALTWGADELFWEAASASLFYGTVASWPQRFDISDRVAWVPLSCFDGFDKLARAKIPRSVMESAIMPLGPVGYWPLTDPAGSTTATDLVGVNFGEPFDDPAFGSDEIAPGLGPCVEFDGVNDRIDISRSPLIADTYTFTIAAVIRTAVPADALSIHPVFLQIDGRITSATSAEFYVDTDGQAKVSYKKAGLGYAFESTAAVDDGDPHLVIVQGNSGSGGVAVDSATLSTTAFGSFAQSGNGTAIGGTPFADRGYDDNFFPGCIAHVAVFDFSLSLAQRQTIVDAYAALAGQTTDQRIGWILDELGWPTNLRDFDTGVAELGPATFKPGDGALDYFRLIDQSEDGRLFINPDGQLRFQNRYWRYLNSAATTAQFTFTDATGIDGYSEFDLDLDDELLVNVARFTRRGGTEQVATNAASVALHGEAEVQRSDLLLTSDAEVLSLAEWTVASQSEVLPRVPKVRVPISRYDADAAFQVLSLDLGERVATVRSPQGLGTAISSEFVIDGLRHEIDGSQWWLEAYVSPVPEATVNLAVYDTSVYDGTDVYAP